MSQPKKIVLTGYGYETPETLFDCIAGISTNEDYSHDCKAVEFLKSRKTFKFMSKQDRLGLSAAGKAVHSSSLSPQKLQKSGIYMTVGYLPFLKNNIEEICTNSLADGTFSMKRFSSDGINRVSPLLTFTCLPNMAAHHIAMNFGIQGRYMITYPDTAQLYQCLNESAFTLKENSHPALLGAVADQNNFLVKHHYQKTNLKAKLVDSAVFLVLELEESAIARNARIRARLIDYGTSKKVKNANNTELHFGCCEMPIGLVAAIQAGEKSFIHNSASHFCCWEMT